MTVVSAHIISGSIVADNDEFNGRCSVVSDLPQYFITAMLIGALHVTKTESFGICGSEGGGVDGEGLSCVILGGGWGDGCTVLMALNDK